MDAYRWKSDRKKDEERGEERGGSETKDRAKGFLSTFLSRFPLLLFALPALLHTRLDPLSSSLVSACTRVSFAELRSSTMLLVYERDPRVVGLRLEAAP